MLVGGIAFTDENRKIVKQVFNAMLNAKRMMIRQPRGLDLKPLRKKWSEIVPIVYKPTKIFSICFLEVMGVTCSMKIVVWLKMFCSQGLKRIL